MMGPGGQFLIFPGDTRPVNVPAHLVQKALAANAKPYNPTPATPATFQQAWQGARPFSAQGMVPQSSAPMMGKFATDPQTIAMAATAPMGGIGGIPGVLARSAVGAATAGGTAALGGNNVAGNAILGAAPEPLIEGAKAGAKGTAKLLMKTSIGRAAPGSVEKALKYGFAPTERFIAGVGKRIAAAKEAARGYAAALEAEGKQVTFDQLSAPLKQQAARFARHDITGTQPESALNDILSTMENKIGPQTIPASTIVAPGRGVVRAEAGPAIPAVIHPAQPVTPTQLQEIAQIAREKANDLLAARAGKAGVVPDPKERGYVQIWITAKKLLEDMGPKGKSINRLNNEMKNLYNMDALARSAGARSHGITGLEKAAGLGIAGGGIAAHNPVMAGSSIPLMLAMHQATSPTGMAAMARGLNSPLGQGVAGGIPRNLALLLGQIGNQ